MELFMGHTRITSATATGPASVLVAVDATIEEAGPAGALRITGIPDAPARQVQTRVRSAIANSSMPFPRTSIDITIAPDTATGSATDLAVAIAILGAAGTIPVEALTGAVLLAELGLDGSLRPVPGIVPALAEAHRAGIRTAIVAGQNAAEAALVDGMSVYAVDNLATLTAWLHGQVNLHPVGLDTDTVPCRPFHDTRGAVVAQAHQDERPNRRRRILKPTAASDTKPDTGSPTDTDEEAGVPCR
jgi:magnesium chelatase family protein